MFAFNPQRSFVIMSRNDQIANFKGSNILQVEANKTQIKEKEKWERIEIVPTQNGNNVKTVKTSGQKERTITFDDKRGHSKGSGHAKK
ncbi:hypothetical protein PVAND_017192 [Polypedilum vanderplanki]|uniref:Uncharacterized protein n=1 Tax=Polypedilum vanderplanki TaxID=319348 RepID=A0A9J6BI08_POLVA|nr:hypothetical protein PVAND_017192 [Polypedilum vanderplanki]